MFRVGLGGLGFRGLGFTGFRVYYGLCRTCSEKASRNAVGIATHTHRETHRNTHMHELNKLQMRALLAKEEHDRRPVCCQRNCDFYGAQSQETVTSMEHKAKTHFLEVLSRITILYGLNLRSENCSPKPQNPKL